MIENKRTVDLTDMPDIQQSDIDAPVFNVNTSGERESLVARVSSMRATQATASDRIHDVRLKLPLRARLEPSFKSDANTNDIPIEAQRDVRLGLMKSAPRLLGVEYYETLKAKLWARYSEQKMKVVLFVGATVGSGASTSASNFAAMLARDPQTKVLLIDANLRQEDTGRQARKQIPQAHGSVTLAGLLSADLPISFPLPGPGNLYVLPSGTKCDVPLSLFQSDAFDQFLESVRERFNHVVIDAPPLQGFPESIVLSRKADGVILVVEAGKTRKREGLWAKQQIEDAGGKILGVVLNKRKFYIPDWLYSHT